MHLPFFKHALMHFIHAGALTASVFLIVSKCFQSAGSVAVDSAICLFIDVPRECKALMEEFWPPEGPRPKVTFELQ
jgi:hypothetical protein